MTGRSLLLSLSLLGGALPSCGVHERGGAAHASSSEATAMQFIMSRLQPWPAASSPGQLAVTEPTRGRIAVYDSALAALTLMRYGRRDAAGRILVALAALQRPDGSLPFSFVLPRPDDGPQYVRSGAIAWVGYAAAEYLDAEAGGEGRKEAAELAHRAARYLLEHQISAADSRDGLVRGGTGTFRYVVRGRKPHEVLVPGEVPWVSVEHNIDAYFFLRRLAKIAKDENYAAAATRIERALLQRGWDATRGQLVRGFSQGSADPGSALDCASWGAVFLDAAGDRDRARTAAAVADAGYATLDSRSGARGHRAYASGPLLENAELMSHFAAGLAAPTWDKLEAIWPEGSAGVALAALRAGRRERAKSILDALEPLRQRDGSFPTLTVDVPFEFDTRPSIAGTAWVELVRFELSRDSPSLWAP